MGTVVKRGDSWRAQVRKSGTKTLSKTFSKKVLADKWVKETELAIEAGEFDREDPDFGSLVQRYIDEILPMKPMQRTHVATLRTLRRKVAGVRVSELNPTWMVEFAKGMDMAPSTRAQYFVFLGMVLKKADALWDIRPNWEDWRRGREVLLHYDLIGRSQQRDRRVTDEDVAEILDNMRSGLPMDDLIQFAIESAVRLAELTRVRWADVDHAKKTLLIRDRKHPSKKKGNHMTIPLLGEAYPIVKRQIKQNELIFPYDPNSISAAFHRATVRAGIVDMRWHDLRHEGISRLFEKGYRIEEVALVSGHASWNMLKRYTHLSPESLHRDAA